MVSMAILVATTALLQAASSLSLPPSFKTVLINNVVQPKTIHEFSKNNVTAKWAPEYPKEWGSEDCHHVLNTPNPADTFNSVITDDGKVLVSLNSTHAEVFDLVNNVTASIFPLEVPDTPPELVITGALARSATQGGYDVFYGVALYKYYTWRTTFRQRVGPDLKPIGKAIAYDSQLSAISKQGKMATLRSQIFDLTTTNNTPIATLQPQPDIVELSYSPDGVYLASVSSNVAEASLWNATSGTKIFAFPVNEAVNWNPHTRFSPDGKYLAIALGSYNGTVQIYTVQNLSAPPIEFKLDFKSEVLDWSPDSQQIVIWARGRLQIVDVPSKEVVQTWQVDAVDASGDLAFTRKFHLILLGSMLYADSSQLPSGLTTVTRLCGNLAITSTCMTSRRTRSGLGLLGTWTTRGYMRTFTTGKIRIWS
jgi:hypothetical protein